MVLALLGAFKRRKQTLLLNTHFQAANFWVIEAPCHVQEAHWTRVVGLTGNLFFTDDTEWSLHLSIAVSSD